MKQKSLTNLKQCEWCGDTFTFTLFNSQKESGHTGRFCSLFCRNVFTRSRAFSIPCAICSTGIFVQPAQLKYRSRKTCSKSCRAIYRRKQAEHRQECFGYTKHQLDRLARYSTEAEVWRKAVFERDDFTCQLCGKRGDYIEADHIKPWAYFPGLRFELSNGRTLCRPCHDETKIGWREMRRIYATI